jgi:ankyrin repeat protein
MKAVASTIVLRFPKDMLRLVATLIWLFALATPHPTRATTYAYRPTEGICAAAADGDLVKVDRFVAANPDAINERDGGGTPLHWAVIHRHLEIVAYLLDHGADANSLAGESKYTPLHHAADQEPNEMLRLLLAHGADPNARTARGESALYFACSYGHLGSMLERVQMLLDVGADPNLKSMSEATPLQSAAFRGPNSVLSLLMDKGADVNASGFRGATALHWAVDGQNKEAVELLLDRGADINARDGDGRTALKRAEEKAAEKRFWKRGKLKRIIKFLVGEGAKE